MQASYPLLVSTAPETHMRQLRLSANTQGVLLALALPVVFASLLQAFGVEAGVWQRGTVHLRFFAKASKAIFSKMHGCGFADMCRRLCRVVKYSACCGAYRWHWTFDSFDMMGKKGLPFPFFGKKTCNVVLIIKVHQGIFDNDARLARQQSRFHSKAA